VIKILKKEDIEVNTLELSRVNPKKGKSQKIELAVTQLGLKVIFKKMTRGGEIFFINRLAPCHVILFSLPFLKEEKGGTTTTSTSTSSTSSRLLASHQ